MNRKKTVLIAAVILVCLLAVTAAVLSQKGKTTEITSDKAATETAADPGEYVNAYLAVLRSSLDAEGIKSRASFSFDYVDSDDIPELIISKGTYHAATATIYTFDGLKVNELVSGGELGRIQYSPKEGIIVSKYTQQGCTTVKVYRTEDGVCDLVWSGRDTSGMYGEEDAEYLSDGTDVSKEEYDRKYAEYVPENLVYSLFGEDTGYIGKGMYMLTEDEISKLEIEPVIIAHTD